jgi:peptide/nickel transport system substrate-binding protein
MTKRIPRRFAALAVVAVAASGIAACGKSSTPSTSGGPPSKPTGTLNVVAASGPDHYDTVSAYYTVDYMLERVYARQMLSYPYAYYNKVGDAGWNKSVTPVPDAATEVPTASNGGITNGGKTYTFHIKSGVDWNTSPARQVTASDFIREFKAFCNPVSPVGNIGYYESTVAGLTSYCNAEAAFFAKKSNKPTAANIANFQNTHTISGLSAPNSLTLQINLSQPASDFIYMMAMPFSSARPVEYDAYVPNSLQLDQHTISDGPYQITGYTPGKSITLATNPAWKQSTDTLRHQYVKNINITAGVTSAATQLADMKAGTQDLGMDVGIEPSAIPGLIASKNPEFKIWGWVSTVPYVVFNLRSPDASGAMNKLLVRQAVEVGLDKVAVQKAQGGPALASIINDAVPPGSAGYKPYNLYPDNNGNGNAAACKADLAKAGLPHGFTALYLYPNDSVNTQIFTAIQASLANCGITVKGKPEPGSSFFVDLGNAPENNKANQWDMASAGWIADWFGPNNGRTTIQALYQTNCVVNTTNDGCYSSPTVDGLIKQAEAATSLATASALWHQADIQVMKDAVVVPLTSTNFAGFNSTRVRSYGLNGAIVNQAAWTPNIGDYDLANTWLSG